jgi:hypothetical protein
LVKNLSAHTCAPWMMLTRELDASNTAFRSSPTRANTSATCFVRVVRACARACVSVARRARRGNGDA